MWVCVCVWSVVVPVRDLVQPLSMTLMQCPTEDFNTHLKAKAIRRILQRDSLNVFRTSLLQTCHGPCFEPATPKH